MPSVIKLPAHACCMDRSFTVPSHTDGDQALLSAMLTCLRHLLFSTPALVSPMEWREDDRYHRILLGDTTVLCNLPYLILVGFFGQRRPSADITPILQIDGGLVAELALHTGILCYYTVELADSNYANLILFCDEAAKDHWRTSALHTDAVQRLAPHYYATVRIHNGFVPGGLPGKAAPVIERTKYYDYTAPVPWHATREFGASSVFVDPH